MHFVYFCPTFRIAWELMMDCIRKKIFHACIHFQYVCIFYIHFLGTKVTLTFA